MSAEENLVQALRYASRRFGELADELAAGADYEDVASRAAAAAAWPLEHPLRRRMPRWARLAAANTEAAA